MRSDSHIVNGLNAYILNTTQSSSYTSLLLEEALVSPYHVHMGIRVWARDSSSSETEITSGTAIAIAEGTGLKSGTWSCPEKTLASIDSIVIRVYYSVNTSPNILIATFGTEQLGASWLNASTWTVYYYIYRVLSGGKGSKAYFYDWYFQFGDSSHNSRVSGMVLTEAVAPSPTWNLIASTSDLLVVGSWNQIGIVSYNLKTPFWNLISQFSENLVIGSWNLIGQFSDNLLTASWNLIGYTWDLLIPPSGALVKAWLIIGAMFLGSIFIGIVAYTQRRKFFSR